jgi:hypothetical protein
MKKELRAGFAAGTLVHNDDDGGGARCMIVMMQEPLSADEEWCRLQQRVLDNLAVTTIILRKEITSTMHQNEPGSIAAPHQTDNPLLDKIRRAFKRTTPFPPPPLWLVR